MRDDVSVVYFSIVGETHFPEGKRYVEKGNTAIVADKLAAMLDCPEFEIVPVDRYPAEYRGQVDRAKKELAE